MMCTLSIPKVPEVFFFGQVLVLALLLLLPKGLIGIEIFVQGGNCKGKAPVDSGANSRLTVTVATTDESEVVLVLVIVLVLVLSVLVLVLEQEQQIVSVSESNITNCR